MDAIAQSHDGPPAGPEGAAAAEAAWLDSADGLVARIAQALSRLQAHPARSVVLLPYAQLMPLAARMWARARPDGFAPRFQTTMNWTRSLGPAGLGADDIRLDTALDSLTAQTLLERAGLRGHADVLVGRLVQAAHQLAPLAAACAPAERPAWAAAARPALGLQPESPVFALEAAMARIALEWAAASAYATDRLWALLDAGGAPDALVVLQGFQREPMTEALVRALGVRAAVLPLARAAARGQVLLHPARDAQDEAERAAACVLRHLAEGRQPVALAAVDRALTRRVRAMLGAGGVALRDETGWKLSTTRAAAHAMAALRACAWNAGSDAVLDWLKSAPALAGARLVAMEKALRRAGLGGDWQAWVAAVQREASPFADFAGDVARIEDWRGSLQSPRPLAEWLQALRTLLQAAGQWEALRVDEAGQKVIDALHLAEPAQAALAQALAGTAWATRRMAATAFIAWADQALEGASHVPAHPPREQVVILPLSQLLARPFTALVVPGCDEVRLPAAPEPPGEWSAQQRAALGLPTRETLAQAQRDAWDSALQVPAVDVLWRHGDDGGEPVLPSALVQAVQLQGAALGEDPRSPRVLEPTGTQRPLPAAPQLGVARLSASAYADLRQCPYRFFALRQLGLQEADELEVEVDKRDVGLWLHDVLKLFHEGLRDAPAAERAERAKRLNAAAEAARQARALGADEFLPFAAAWPQLREGYLDWLAAHEATGAAFARAEDWREQPLGPVTLIGQIDRIDTLADGAALVIDYKTEALSRTRERISQAGEDTQLPFYAALLPDDQLRAAYLNVSEREGSKIFAQDDVVTLRDALVQGILHDMARIAQGAVLPALGEGAACDYCAARGLCRKDFWT